MYILVFFLYFQPNTEPFVMEYQTYRSQAECSEIAERMVAPVRAIYNADGAEAICYKMQDIPA